MKTSIAIFKGLILFSIFSLEPKCPFSVKAKKDKLETDTEKTAALQKIRYSKHKAEKARSQNLECMSLEIVRNPACRRRQ